MKKKSGAARRLVSLMLALGLIFTLAPASVFAGDAVPASSTAVTTVAEPAVEGTEPAVEGTEPAVEGTEPAVEGTEPAVEGTEPAVEGTEPAVEGTEPAVEGTEPAVEGTEPAVEGTEPAVKDVPAQQVALMAASAPVVMSSGPQTRGIDDRTLRIVEKDPGIVVYAVTTAWALDSGDWYNDGDPVETVTHTAATSNDQVYFLISVPDNQELVVKFTESGKSWPNDPNGDVYEIRGSGIPQEKEALKKGLTHYFVFSGDFLSDDPDLDISVKYAQTDAYFYLHRYDVPTEEVDATDFYYVGQGKVNLSTPTIGDRVTAGVDSYIADELKNYKPVVLNSAVNQLYPGLMTYSYSESGTAGTYTVASWDIIKGESGATEAYPSETELVASGIPTWHVDGTISLKKPVANFYAQVEGDPTAVYSMGTGDVTFRAAQLDETIDLTKIIPARAQEEDILTEPASFPEIPYKGHKYTYVAQDKGDLYTYTLVGWDEAVGVSGANGEAEWRVNGKIKLNTPPEFTDEMKPDVEATPVVYDGQTHGLTINYKEDYLASDFKVTYEVWEKDKDTGTESWKKLPDGQVPEQTDAGSLKVRVTFEYLSEQDPHLPWPVEVSIDVSKRPLTLTVQNVTITTDDIPSFTVTPSAEGTDTGLLTSLGHTLDDWEINENYKNNEAGEYEITLQEDSWVIKDAAGNDVSKNYSVTPAPGKLTVKDPLPANLRPIVSNTSVTYDGQAHGVSISYPSGPNAPAADEYTVEYQVAGGAWSETVPSLTNVDKIEKIKVRFTYDKYATYEDIGEYTLEVTQRPITLKANDEKIIDGEKIPSFSFSITAGSLVEGDSITGVTYGGYVDKLGIYDLIITGYKIVDTKDNNANVTGNYDVDLLKGTFTIGSDSGSGSNPNPNPTPVPTPVPETPVTPVAPVTPDDEEEEPEVVEEIEEEETPQASPDTDADKEDDKTETTETIEEDETAQAGAPGAGNWALLNLILMVLTVVAGLAMLALRFARKTGMAHLLGIVPAIVALVAFFVTEDMSLPMAMTDKWTLIMAVIALVQVALLLLGRNGAQDDQPREQY